MPLPDPTKPLRIVLLSDPNLDAEKMDVSRYIETYDESLIIDKDKANPATRFVLHPIPRRQLLAIDDSNASVKARFREAAMVSLRSIELPNGKTLEPQHVQTTKRGKEQWKRANDDWEDLIMDRWGVDGLEVCGSVAYRRARMPLENADPLG